MSGSRKIVLLDGGMGQELIRRSKQPPSPLWSAKVMMDEGEIVEAVHREYIEAGAKVITLNSYSATPERLARDASEDLFQPLQAKAIEIAKSANAEHEARVAGCLPPLVASYNPQLAPDFDKCLATYRKIVDVQNASVDLFLCETMSSAKEASAATTAAAETGKPVWCALSVDDDNPLHLRSGEKLEEGIDAAKAAGASAILLNCSMPEAINAAMPILAGCGLPFGAYANGFTRAADLKPGGTVADMKVRTDLTPKAHADIAMKWIEAGASIIGGCCEVGPAHIQELAKRLESAGHTIVGELK